MSCNIGEVTENLENEHCVVVKVQSHVQCITHPLITGHKRLSKQTFIAVTGISNVHFFLIVEPLIQLLNFAYVYLSVEVI